MPALITLEGQLAELQLIKDNADWWIVLYTNTLTIDQNTVFADLTVATFDGAAGQPLDAWDDPATVSGKAEMTHPEIVFQLASGAGQTCKGVAIYDGDSNLITARNFSVDRVFVNVGDALKFNPVHRYYDVSLA